MKEITGYLIDRTTGLGISGKTVTYDRLDGSDPVVGTTDGSGTTGTYFQSLGSPTDANGKFTARFELSPGPVNINVDVGASEKKARKYDEKAQMGVQWSSDISRIGKALGSGFVKGFLNEMALSITSGHTYAIATGGAVIDGGSFTIENGPISIPGNANPSGPANPRLDLITLRQYKESAAGQDSGRQRIVVTEGTVSSVVPATPTGADFVDLPLGVVSTGQGAGTKTVHADLRVFAVTPSPISDIEDYSGPSSSLTLSYFTAVTLSAPALDPGRVYDGTVFIHGDAVVPNITTGDEFLQLRLNSPFMLGGAVVGYNIMSRTLASGSERESFSYSHPIVGLTGVSSFSLPVEFRNGSAGTPGPTIQKARGMMVLVPRS